MAYHIPDIKGFTNSTSKNDACPSIYYRINKDRGLQLFCDHDDQSLSEFEDLDPKYYFRYTLVLQDEQTTLLQSNDVEEVKRFITHFLENEYAN